MQDLVRMSDTKQFIQPITARSEVLNTRRVNNDEPESKLLSPFQHTGG